jgi:DNA primase
MYEDAANVYAEDAFGDDEAMTYLMDERGFEMSTIADFRLGIVRNPVSQEHERFRGMICIPNHCGSANEHVVGLKFRDISPEPFTKYAQPAGVPVRLFNLRAMNHISDTLYVTEGEFDTIALEQVGLSAVAVPGVSHWEKGGAFRARLMEGLHVVLCRDTDDAAEKLIVSMRRTVDDIVVREFAPWKDVNEFMVKEGAEALLKRAEQGQ